MTLNEFIRHKLDESNVEPEFLEDCKRICDVAKTMNLDLSYVESYRIWEHYSSSRDAQWLSVNENADVICAIHEYVRKSVDRYRARLLVGEYA